MTENATMCQMIQCMKAMKQAAEDDAAYANSKKRKDGTASWLSASYNFSRLMGVNDNTYSPDQMREFYRAAIK